MRILLLLLLLSVLLFAAPSRSLAQEEVSLDRVETFIAQGRILQARQTLEAWWNRIGPEASRIEWQRSIWLRGKLTVDPSMAQLDYRRLVLEYPGGPYSDDALHRLALAAEAKGALREAHSHFQMLIRDYPSSSLRPQAQRWVQEHAVEVAVLPSDTVSDRRLPQQPPEEEGVGDFSIQLGAFRSLDRARVLADQIKEVGYQSRLVRTPGNDLARVRVGRFSSREEAEAFGRALGRLGFDFTLATDAGAEERVGLRPGPRGPGTRS
jgi:hypothetical protein